MVLQRIEAALAPHGIALRGVARFAPGAGPELAGGGHAQAVVLLGNIGGSIWPAFATWAKGQAPDLANPLDAWSKAVIGPLARELGATAWFPSDPPWQPFQTWAIAAEGIAPGPLGLLVHPDWGPWHGYRGALGFAEPIPGEAPASAPVCAGCAERPCLRPCPVGAVGEGGVDIARCRGHLATPEGAPCRDQGCRARAACPVGAAQQYPRDQLRFHMAAFAGVAR